MPQSGRVPGAVEPRLVSDSRGPYVPVRSMSIAPRNEPAGRIALVGVTLAFAVVAGVVGCWFDCSGVLPLPRADALTFLATYGGGVVLLGVLAAGIWHLKFGGRAVDGFTRFLAGAAFLSGMFSLLLVLLFLNTRFDSGGGEPAALVPTDRFVLEVQRRDMQRPFVLHFAAFAVPEGLEPYALVQLRPNAAQDCGGGRPVRVVRHPGFFAVPWFEFLDPIDGTKNQSIAAVARHFQILSSRGVFARRSALREELRRRGVPIQDAP